MKKGLAIGVFVLGILMTGISGTHERPDIAAA